MPRSRFLITAAILLGLFPPGASRAEFDLQLTISNPSFFTDDQLSTLQTGIGVAERLWESVIAGYQPGITQTVLEIEVMGSFQTGLADARVTGFAPRAGGRPFSINTEGLIRINPGGIDTFSDFLAVNGNGERVNVIDELIAHEIAHVLGVGTRWVDNGVYVNGSGQYTGRFGLATYRRDFDPDAPFIPVELSNPPGGDGSANFHWDQQFRGAGEAGVPIPPMTNFDLSPLTGMVDNQGRDLGLEILTAALDPDYGEPFLAAFSVQSLRDIGFVVRPIPEPSGAGLVVACLLATVARRRERGPLGRAA